MTDLQKQIADATARVAQINQEMADHQKQALAAEEDARGHRRAYDALKQERGSLSQVLAHSQVANSALQAETAAKSAQADAEKHRDEASQTLARLKEKEEQLDALLAKAAKADDKATA